MVQNEEIKINKHYSSTLPLPLSIVLRSSPLVLTSFITVELKEKLHTEAQFSSPA